MKTYCSLLLIRHGQARAQDGSYDEATPLSDVGRRQAICIANSLAGRLNPAVIYSSPYPRSIETARPLADALGMEPIMDRRLAEFAIGPNTLGGVQQRSDLLIWHPDHSGAGQSETLRAFSTRVASFCEEAVQRHKNVPVAIFTHSGTIDAVLRWAVGLTPDAPWQHECDMGTASITEIEVWPHGRVDGGAPRHAVIRRIGDCAHLGDLVSDF